MFYHIIYPVVALMSPTFQGSYTKDKDMIITHGKLYIYIYMR